MKRCLVCSTSFSDPGWRCPNCGWAPQNDPYLRFADADASFPEESFELLTQLEERSFWFRARNRLIVWALSTHFPRAASLLEVGCGTGYVLAELHVRFPELRLVGGELSPRGIEAAQARLPGVPLLEVDARHLPFDREFDVVAAFDVLEHIEEDETALAEFARSANVGGGVLLTVPQHPWLSSSVDEYSGHVRRYTRDDLVTKLMRAGLRVVRVTSFVSLLLPVVAASRLLRRRAAAESYDPATEYTLPAAVSLAFERAMSLERRLIARGVSFPAGSSLLAVAVRD